MAPYTTSHLDEQISGLGDDGPKLTASESRRRSVWAEVQREPGNLSKCKNALVPWHQYACLVRMVTTLILSGGRRNAALTARRRATAGQLGAAAHKPQPGSASGQRMTQKKKRANFNRPVAKAW